MSAVALRPRERDPRATRRLAWLVTAAVLLWPLARLAEFHPATLFDPANARVMAAFLGGFVPPSTTPDFLHELLAATLTTLAIATAGIALAFVIAVPLAIAATRSLSIAAIGPARGRWRGGALRHGVRTLTVVLRSVPEIVWALVFVRATGLGPAAGVLALAVTYGGMLAKVYSEILESADARPVRALLQAGSGRLAALCYGLVPLAAEELVSYTVYRWECAIRAAVVMGFVGAGGLGQLMDQAIKGFVGGEASSIALVFLALVMLADGTSAVLRRVLSTLRAPRFAGLACVATIAAAVVASFLHLATDFGGVFDAEARHAMARFVLEFFPPDLSAEFLRKVGGASLQTLAVSLLGTLVPMVLGGLLALPAAGRLGRAPRWAARTLLNGLRSLPELVWGALMVLAAGLGPFAGTLALALHTTGVLGRLFAESLENASPVPESALRELGAGPVARFVYGTLPLVAAQCLGYTLYRWEMNIRMAAILGFVGAGGLGQLLYFHLSLFQQAQAATVLAAMTLLVLADDALSGWARRSLSAQAH
jgi:phosphonate transport system permease protein